MHVVIAGPDGTGKSTVAEALAHRLGESRPVQRLHYDGTVPVDGSTAGEPHEKAAHSVLASWAKVLVTGALVAKRMWPSLRAKELLVLQERGWYDQVVDPLRYRLHRSARWFATLIGGAFPRADVCVCLVGDPSQIAARKNELSAVETERQIEEWKRLSGNIGRRVVFADTTTASSEQVVSEIVSAIALPVGPTLRRVRLAPSRLALRASRGCSRGGALSIYVPGKQITMAITRVPLWMRLGASRAEAADAIALDALRDIGVAYSAIASMRSSAPGRHLYGVESDRSAVAFAKVGGLDDEGLANEARTLELACSSGQDFLPELLLYRETAIERVLVTRAIPGRALRQADLALLPQILLDLQEMRARLGRNVHHGDLAPWNLILSGAKLHLVDWESSRVADTEFWDLVHLVARCVGWLSWVSPSEGVDLLDRWARLLAPDMSASEMWADLESTASTQISELPASGADRMKPLVLHIVERSRGQ